MKKMFSDLRLFFSSLVFVSSVFSSPLPVDSDNRLHLPPVDPSKWLCRIPILKEFLCPHTGSDATNINTALGLAIGTLDPFGATRFVVKYANANRWAPSTVVSNWSLP